jgi:DNA transposition AAA+ family ATPase
VARGIGVSPASVSQFLAGKYTGDNNRLTEKLKSWLKRQYEQQGHREIFTETVDTFAIIKVKDACRTAHIQGEMVVITGDSGVGKSRGLQAYAASNPDVIMIRVIPSYSMRDLMSEIHKRVGLNGDSTVTGMSNDVIEKMANSGRLIIVDEAEHLPKKALEMLRTIYDMAGIGIVLAGMPHLIINMRGSRGEFKQIYSRIAMHAEIPNMKKHPQDIQKLVKLAAPNSNGIWKTFAQHSANARQIEKLLKMSIQIAHRNDSEITPEIVREAKKAIIT